MMPPEQGAASSRPGSMPAQTLPAWFRFRGTGWRTRTQGTAARLSRYDRRGGMPRAGLAGRRADLCGAAALSVGVRRRDRDGRDPALGQSRDPHRRLRLGGAAGAPFRRQHADGSGLRGRRALDARLRAAQRGRPAVHRAADVGRRLWRAQPHQHGLCVRRRYARRHACRAQPRGQHDRAGARARARRPDRDAHRSAHGVRDLRRCRPRRGAARADLAAAAPDRRATHPRARADAGRSARSMSSSSSWRSAPTACSPRRSRPCSPI